MSESLLATALAKAQGQFKKPTLNRTAKIKNAQGQLLYETHYADLEECISCIKEPLSTNGLSFTQTIDFIHTPKEMWVLRLTLRHGSGELIDSILPLDVNKPPQQLGGALTYFKRYQISAFFGLAADFDDDGNAAQGEGKIVDGQKKQQAAKPPQAKPPEKKVEPEKKSHLPDPAHFVMPFGGAAKGLALKSLPEATLKGIHTEAVKQLALTPDNQQLKDVETNVRLFLDSVGVKI